MQHPEIHPPRQRLATAAVGAVLALMVGLLSACSDSSAQGSGEPAEGAGNVSQALELSSHPVATTSEVAKVYGRLPKSKRAAVRRQVTKVVDAWWEAAYLGGTYPRTGFEEPFPGFTRGAGLRARNDKRLMTNRDISEDIDSVVARHRRVVLDVLAVDRTARAVTARFKLRFKTTSGEEAEQVVVSGRLFLSKRTGAWRIFGYDVAKGDRS